MSIGNKICKMCGKEYTPNSGRQEYCAECRRIRYNHKRRVYNKTHKNKADSIKARWNKKKAEEFGVTQTELQQYLAGKVYKKLGMSASEYNAYREEQRALKLGLTLEEYRHYCYLSKKNKTPLFEVLGFTKEEYERRLKGR